MSLVAASIALLFAVLSDADGMHVSAGGWTLVAFAFIAKAWGLL